MIVFHSDLDNTLIYSYRHEIGSEKECVEIYHGREVSFMTRRSLHLLRQIKDLVVFVPTTTRTEEQYHRICLGVGEVEYALVCNGGVLLRDGQEDTDWYQESLALMQDCKQELIKAQKCLQEDMSRSFEVRNIRDLFIFTKSDQPFHSAERLRQILDLSLVEVFCNGSKVYVLPIKLNKGAAVKRFAKRLGGGTVIAAGDSAFDLPMLQAADLAWAPETLIQEIDNQKRVIGIGEETVFSDRMLSQVLTYCKRSKEGM